MTEPESSWPFAPQRWPPRLPPLRLPPRLPRLRYQPRRLRLAAALLFAPVLPALVMTLVLAVIMHMIEGAWRPRSETIGMTLFLFLCYGVAWWSLGWMLHEAAKWLGLRGLAAYLVLGTLLGAAAAAPVFLLLQRTLEAPTDADAINGAMIGAAILCAPLIACAGIFWLVRRPDKDIEAFT